MKEDQEPKVNPLKLKPSLGWHLEDFLAANEEPLPCVVEGKTEGEIMEREEVLDWIIESLRALRVFQEDYPAKYPEQKQIFDLDLAYLVSLGKITKEEERDILKPENFIYEEPK